MTQLLQLELHTKAVTTKQTMFSLQFQIHEQLHAHSYSTIHNKTQTLQIQHISVYMYMT